MAIGGNMLLSYSPTTKLFTDPYLQDALITGGPALQASQVTLLMPMNDLIDRKGNTVTVVGNAHVDSSITHFGANSLSVQGAAGRLHIPYSTAWDFTTAQNFASAEAWIYSPAYSGGFNGIMGQVAVDNDHNWFFGVYGDRSISISQNGVNEIRTPAGLVVTGKWSHVAVIKRSATTYLYVNGVKQASATTGVWTSTTNALLIGTSFTGNICNVRLTKG